MLPDELLSASLSSLGEGQSRALLESSSEWFVQASSSLHSLAQELRESIRSGSTAKEITQLLEQLSEATRLIQNLPAGLQDALSQQQSSGLNDADAERPVDQQEKDTIVLVPQASIISKAHASGASGVNLARRSLHKQVYDDHTGMAVKDAPQSHVSKDTCDQQHPDESLSPTSADPAASALVGSASSSADRAARQAASCEQMHTARYQARPKTAGRSLLTNSASEDGSTDVEHEIKTMPSSPFKHFPKQSSMPQSVPESRRPTCVPVIVPNPHSPSAAFQHMPGSMTADRTGTLSIDSKEGAVSFWGPQEDVDVTARKPLCKEEEQQGRQRRLSEPSGSAPGRDRGQPGSVTRGFPDNPQSPESYLHSIPLQQLGGPSKESGEKPNLLSHNVRSSDRLMGLDMQRAELSPQLLPRQGSPSVETQATKHLWPNDKERPFPTAQDQLQAAGPGTSHPAQTQHHSSQVQAAEHMQAAAHGVKAEHMQQITSVIQGRLTHAHVFGPRDLKMIQHRGSAMPPAADSPGDSSTHSWWSSQPSKMKQATANMRVLPHHLQQESDLTDRSPNTARNVVRASVSSGQLHGKVLDHPDVQQQSLQQPDNPRSSLRHSKDRHQPVQHLDVGEGSSDAKYNRTPHKGSYSQRPMQDEQSKDLVQARQQTPKSESPMNTQQPQWHGGLPPQWPHPVLMPQYRMSPTPLAQQQQQPSAAAAAAAAAQHMQYMYQNTFNMYGMPVMYPMPPGMPMMYPSPPASFGSPHLHQMVAPQLQPPDVPLEHPSHYPSAWSLPWTTAASLQPTDSTPRHCHVHLEALHPPWGRMGPFRIVHTTSNRPRHPRPDGAALVQAMALDASQPNHEMTNLENILDHVASMAATVYRGAAAPQLAPKQQRPGGGPNNSLPERVYVVLREGCQIWQSGSPGADVTLTHSKPDLAKRWLAEGLDVEIVARVFEVVLSQHGWLAKLEVGSVLLLDDETGKRDIQ